MTISKVKVLELFFQRKERHSYLEQVLRYHFSSLGKIEEYMTSKDITEEGKRLVMFAFYYIAIKDNSILVEYIKKVNRKTTWILGLL